jgi:hypothetical protein
MPSEGNPLGLGAPVQDMRQPTPAPLGQQRQLAPPREGQPFNAFMATGGEEAPPPIPFNETTDTGAGQEAPPKADSHLQPPPAPGKRGRKIKLKP